MKTVEITEGFTGYPNDKERKFAVGETPTLSNDYADLIIGKGHAVEVKAVRPKAKARAAAVDAAENADAQAGIVDVGVVHDGETIMSEADIDRAGDALAAETTTPTSEDAGA